MASVIERASKGLRLPALPAASVAIVAAAPIALGLSRVLPEHGVGLGLRLAAASACVLLLPGGLILRAIHWPARISLALAGSIAWSLIAVGVALALTFKAEGSLSLTVAVFGILTAGALLAALRGLPRPGTDRSDLIAVLGLVGVGLALCGAVWWVSTTVDGDALFHLARARKLDTLPVLTSLNAVDEFRDGGLHPGYAFPLWHGVLALIARLAGVDSTLVVLHLSAVLAPLALVLAYAAGAALFRSWAGGVATAAGQAAIVGFPRGGVGSFALVALPASATRLLLVPALLALVFAYVRSGHRVELVTITAAACAIAVVHVSYAILIAIPLVGFLLARLVLDRGAGDWRRIVAGLAALALPTGLFVAWLWPTITTAAAFSPSAAERARALSHYGPNLDVFGDLVGLAPEALSRNGAATIAALIAVPALALASKRRFASYVLGATVAILLVLLVPPFFTALSDAVSLSQARRLALFLPLSFALAGGAVLLGGLRGAGCVAALGLGIGLQLAYPGDFSRGASGPVWVAWVALAGGCLALLVGRLLGRRGPETGVWALACALCFVLPIAVAGLAKTTQERHDPLALTPGLVQALRTDVPIGDTVFATPAASYRIAAFAPVYIATAPPGNVAQTSANRPFKRRRDANRFFFGQISDAERADNPRGLRRLLARGRQDPAGAHVRPLAPAARLRGWALRALPGRALSVGHAPLSARGRR